MLHLMSFELFVLSVIEGRRKAPLLRLLFAFFGILYGCIICVRNFLYDRLWLKVYRVPVRVVSIGNIVCGGTGKTPFLCMLTMLLKKKMPTAILTRGYRSPIEKSGQSVQISDEDNIFYPSQECGDEPYLLASKTGCSVFVGKNRVKSALMAIDKGYKILLLDDGMQHRRLHRDSQVVVLDGNDPWGRGAYVPRGLLRDSPRRLCSADLIVVGNALDAAKQEKLLAEIGHFSKAPVVFVDRAYTLELPIESKVGMFCGIAKPQYFQQALIKLGFKVVDSCLAPDHTLPSDLDMAVFAKQCKSKGATALVCTEKDYVKLNKGLVLDLPVVCMKMEMKILEGNETWQKYINKLVQGEAVSHTVEEYHE